MAQSKALEDGATPKTTTDISVLSTMFEADAGVGMENLGQEDLALPFLKVLSGNDPVLDENEQARKGDIYNTVTGALYKGKTGVRVIPAVYQRRFIQWAPRGAGSGAPTAIYESREACPITQRSAEDNKDYLLDSAEYIEETHQHFVLLIGEGAVETALISMKSTQLKKSRKWNSMMASRQMEGVNGTFTPARFSHIYHLRTVSEENSKGSWHGWEMSCEGPVVDEQLYGRAREFASSIKAGEVKVKHESGGQTADDMPFAEQVAPF
jgi:hypothetical protein|tara:strand:+ start:2541 stop:3341 length:801 start_codon:yes stop_codon:yes gene_type:complete